MSEDVIYQEELADLLRCAETTVDEMARDGRLPGIKPGRSWIFPREATMQRLNKLALAEAENRTERATKPKATAPGRRQRRAAAPDLPAYMPSNLAAKSSPRSDA